MNYVVTAPLVIARDAAGRQHHLYTGAPLPADTDADQLKQLIDTEMVGEAPEVEEPEGPPAKSAPKADWEAYARTQGATDEDLDGKTKDELIASFGG